VSIVVNPFSQPEEWMRELETLLPDEVLHLWPDCPDREVVELVVAWRMKRDDLASFPRLEAILSLGAGAEQWQRQGIPDVPIVRLADPSMSDEMAAYALHWIIRLQRHFDVMTEQQKAGSWEVIDYAPAQNFRVGILGYGVIGSRISRAFSDLGYPVNVWSRSGTTDATVTSYAGDDELEAFLGSSSAVINVLPSTTATQGLLNRARFAQFADDAVFVNIGRGNVLDGEDDLIDAIDNGPLRAVVLDVTSPEPPEDDSPLYRHPAVHLTPHVAGSTQVRSSARLIADNVARIRAGVAPVPLVDRSRGY
jgi:glyoxylate/hydroxypyruvate reductase A